MLRKLFLIGLALIGIAFSIFMIYWAARTPPEQPLYFAIAQSPYTHYLAGEGIIETFNENSDLSVPFPDLISDVWVSPGQKVCKKQPLFKLDTRQFEADLKAALAQVERAKTEVKNQAVQFSYFESLRTKKAVSKQQYTEAFYAKMLAIDQLRVAKKEARRIATQIERSIIRAPEDGEILQRNILPGEFANVNPFDRKHLILFGSSSHLQMRVNIAEEDAWRVIPGAPARAYVRGNSSISIPLTFQYIEPYIVPKDQLTGSDFEKVDTRVLQVIYSFDKGENPIYVGQLMDVYMEAKPSRYS